jgi:hypothetical protein
MAALDRLACRVLDRREVELFLVDVPELEQQPRNLVAR